MFNDFALYNTTSVIPAKVLSLKVGPGHWPTSAIPLCNFEKRK